MSFILTDSDYLYCSARSGFAGRGLFEDEVIIEDYRINIGDFCALVEYVLTNTDLADDDPRRELVRHIKTYKEVDGFNQGNKRFDPIFLG